MTNSPGAKYTRQRRERSKKGKKRKEERREGGGKKRQTGKWNNRSQTEVIIGGEIWKCTRKVKLSEEKSVSVRIWAFVGLINDLFIFSVHW